MVNLKFGFIHGTFSGRPERFRNMYHFPSSNALTYGLFIILMTLKELTARTAPWTTSYSVHIVYSSEIE